MGATQVTTVILFGIILASCGNYLELKNPPGSVEQAGQELMAADFAVIKELVFSPRCISCHQQYSSYSGVIREISAIQSAVSAGRMPKSGGPLNDLQKSLLSGWIIKGAPENPGLPLPPPKPEPLKPNWKSISENIIFPKCLVCHNPQGQAKFLDLSHRQAIFDQRNRIFGAQKKLIDLDSPDLSYVLEILQAEEEPMPPIWSNIPRLNKIELQAFKEWIALGLP